MTTFATLLLSVLPVSSEPVRDYFDRAVVSHVYDLEGHKQLSQLIWYDRDRRGVRDNVIDWRMLTKENMPRYDHKAGVWRSTWNDAGTLRVVETRWFDERWDQFDPETFAREELPKEKRRLLTGRKQ